MTLFLLLACTHQPTTLYVDSDAEEGGDGTSWSEAFDSLDDALLEAREGDTVLVATGSYQPASQSFAVPAGVTVEGGYSVDETDSGLSVERDPETTPTVLTCADTCGPVIDAATPVALSGLTVQDAATNGHGGGLRVQGSGTATLADLVLTGNHATGDGGGLWASGATVQASGLTVSANQAEGDGGGLWLEGVTWTGEPPTLEANVADGDGGGARIDSGEPGLAAWTVSGNRAGGSGGGLWLREVSASLDATQVLDNDADLTGGGLWLEGDELDLGGVVVHGNRAYGDGGGLYASSLDTLALVTLTDNVSGGAGGGAWLGGATATIADSTLAGNSAMLGSGAVAAPAATEVWLQRTDFVDNSSASPGGVIDLAEVPVVFEDCLFENNSTSAGDAEIGGGVLDLTGGSLTVTRSTFTGNSAHVNGGTLHVQDTSVVITDSSFTGNVAEVSNGAALRVRGGSLEVRDTAFVDNDGDDDGGALWLSDTSVSLERCLFAGNTAGAGGAAHAYDVDLEVRDSHLRSNSSSALYAAGDSTTRVVNTSFVDNTAGSSGGAIYSYGATLEIHGSSFSGDGASTYRSVLRFSDDDATITNSAFWPADGMEPWSPDTPLDLGPICAPADFPVDLAASLETDPFSRVDTDGDGVDELYLRHAGLDGETESTPCVDAGNGTLATAQGIDWQAGSTRSDGALDEGVLDLGRHHAP